MPGGAGTNLKVGGGTSSKHKWEAPIRRLAPEKNFWSCPSTFWL